MIIVPQSVTPPYIFVIYRFLNSTNKEETLNKLFKHYKIIIFLLVVLFSFSCASSTIINSIPSGAKVYVDGEYRGSTPYYYKDQKIIYSSTYLKLKKKGYDDFNISFQRNEEFAPGPCVGAVLVYFPVLWIMKYRPERTYELEKKGVFI